MTSNEHEHIRTLRIMNRGLKKQKAIFEEHVRQLEERISILEEKWKPLEQFESWTRRNYLRITL